MRLKLSIIVGLLCAVLFTWGRGGAHDAPLVPLFFAVSGFLITYAITTIIWSERIAAIERAADQRRGVPLLRDTAALGLVALSFAFSCHVIQGAGFGGWLVALFLGIVFPLTVCLLASHLPVVFGFLAATSLAVSTLFHHPDFRADPFAREAWALFWQHDVGVWLSIWAIHLGLSLVVSVPLALRRRRTTTRCG